MNAIEKKNKCSFCKEELKYIDKFSMKNVFLVSYAKCDQWSEGGSSTNIIEEFLLCKKCFCKIKPKLNELKKLEKKDDN